MREIDSSLAAPGQVFPVGVSSSLTPIFEAILGMKQLRQSFGDLPGVTQQEGEVSPLPGLWGRGSTRSGRRERRRPPTPRFGFVDLSNDLYLAGE